ncbi:HTH domain-containing protein [Nostocales cyanobacterium LEGE 11386]|nr:HTH domain-containing protein [Nostocales cyanobacterium LEGE 11386]
MNKLLIDGQHALYSPALASRIGRSAATILQQAHYWMGVKGGKTIDGVKWFWKTYQQWAEELSLSVSTVRRAIALLKTLGFIAIEKLSAKTYYQANWYTVKTITVQLFLNEHMDMSIMQTSMCSQRADHIKEFPSQEFASQQHSAVEPLKNEELENENLEYDQKGAGQNPELELPQTTHYVEEPKQDNSTTEIDTHEDHSSAAPVASNFQDEDSGDDDYTEPQEKSVRPSQQEVQEVLQQLREIPCTQQFRLNGEIQRTVKRYWENVPGAIAYLKEALRTWKGVKSPEAVFVAACKEGRKPESAQVKSAVKEWFEWARQKRIVIAISGEVVYTPDGDAVALAEMMRRFPVGE